MDDKETEGGATYRASNKIDGLDDVAKLTFTDKNIKFERGDTLVAPLIGGGEQMLRVLERLPGGRWKVAIKVPWSRPRARLNQIDAQTYLLAMHSDCQPC